MELVTNMLYQVVLFILYLAKKIICERCRFQLQQTDENGDVQDMTEQEQMQEQHNNNNNNSSNVVTQGMNVDEMVSLLPMVSGLVCRYL